MKRRNTHHNRPAHAMSADRANAPWTYILVAIFAGLIFAIGLFFAAQQHFTSMELGIKNAKLRTQLNDLENEKRRLELERAVAMTPQQLKRSARSLGFVESQMIAAAAAPVPAQAAEGEASTLPAADDAANAAVPTEAVTRISTRGAESKPVKTVMTTAEIKKIDQRPRQATAVKTEARKPAAESFDARPSRIVATGKNNAGSVKRTVVSSPVRTGDTKTVARLR